jgi:tetratricopeptide (TPR) repeat protein
MMARLVRPEWHLAVAAFVLGAAAAQQGPAPAQQADTPPTFARDVAPIVHRSCSPCHRPGQPAPFALLSFADVEKRRAQIVEVTQSRLMPPWLVVHGELADDRRLSEQEITTLRRWVEAGAPRGDVAAEPPAPVFASGWQLREPDLIVTAPVALVVAAAGADAVRNLVLPVDVTALRYVEAVEIRPGSRAVHHAVLGVDATRESRRLDAADAEPGFPGMTLGAAVPPDGHFLGWTPGKSVRRNPPGQAWRLRPGDDFVLQLHVVPTGKAEVVQPEIGLWFTAQPTVTTFVPLLLFSERIDIAPGVRDFTLRDHLDLPVPVTIHAIYPHAHYVCRRMRGTVTLPGNEPRVLFGIDAWDFDWQDDYRLREPLVLPAGARLAIEYVYDNSDTNPNNPTRPPRHVRFGQASADEMGTLTVAVAVADAAQRTRLEEATVARQLEKIPDAWNVLLRHAQLARERGDLATATAALARARTISPGSADVVIEQGVCAELAKRPDDARRCYEQALQIDPSRGLAHLQLGALLGRGGDGTGALAHFEQAVRTLPNASIVHNNLATAHFQLGDLAKARTHYERATALDPEYFGSWFNLGRVLRRLGEREPARTALQRAAALRPGDRQVAAELDALGR